MADAGSLVKLLQDAQILQPDQLAEVESVLQHKMPDALPLAQELLRELFGPDRVPIRDDMFTSFTLADQTVPEPASLMLLGSGISALLYRRRRPQ